VWACAWPVAGDPDKRNRSRRVEYDVDDHDIAIVERDTFRLIATSDTFLYKVRVTDTLWGAVILFVKAGDTKIVAFQPGDSVYKAEFDRRDLSITKAPQEILEFDVTNPMIIGNWYRLSARATSGLPVKFESNDNTVALIRAGSDTVHALKKGTVTITATQDGDASWNSASLSRPGIRVLEADSARLIDLQVIAEGGVLSPAFADTVYEYTLTLPCSITKLAVVADDRDEIDLKGGAPIEGDSLITIEESPLYKELSLTVTSKENVAITNTYTIHLLAPLSKELFYRDTENFPHKIEIINRPDIADLRLEGRIQRYRWYRDSVPDPVRQGGIYYDGKGLGGHTYSADISYEAEGDNWVKICEMTITHSLPAASGIEVYPNPAGREITVRYTNQSAADNAEIMIYHLSTGAQAAHYPTGAASAGNNSITLDISQLPAGSYWVRKGTEAAVMVKK
jgi:hypothetical protein